MDIKIGETTYTLQDGITIVGRGDDADLQIDNTKLSRTHTRITVEGKQVFLEDLGSKNGTFINGLAIDGKTELKAGQEGKMGDLPVVLEGAPAPAAVKAAVPAAAGNGSGQAKRRAKGGKPLPVNNIIGAVVALLIIFIAWKNWPEPADLVAARKTIAVVGAEWEAYEEPEEELAAVAERYAALEKLTDQLSTVPAHYSELHSQAGRMNQNIKDEMKRLSEAQLVLKAESDARYMLDAIKADQQQGADPQALIDRLQHLAGSFAQTPAGKEAALLADEIRNSIIGRLRAGLLAAQQDAKQKMAEYRFGAAIAVLNEQLGKTFPEKLAPTVNEVKALAAGIPAAAEAALKEECAAGERLAQRERYDEGRARINDRYTLINLPVLAPIRTASLAKITAIREEKMAAARAQFQREIDKAAGLMQEYKFKEAAGLYQRLLDKAQNAELKKDFIQLQTMAALQRDVKTAIIKMVNAAGEIPLSELGGAGGIIRDLTDSGFSVLEEGNSITMLWKQIGQTEYTALVGRRAEQGDNKAAFVAGVHFLEKGAVTQALPLLEQAASADPQLRTVFKDYYDQLADVVAAKKAAEDAKKAAIAKRREEARLKAEEERKRKMGPTLTTDFGEVMMFPLEHPLNQDVSEYPLNELNDAYINSIGGDETLFVDLSMNYNVIDSSVPLVKAQVRYASSSEPGPYPIPADAWIEGGPMGGPGLDAYQRAGEGDRHILLIDHQAKKLYEFFSCIKIDDENWRVGSAAIFDLTVYKLRPMGWTSADAAGLPIFPTLIRYDEVMEKQEIKHAIRFTVPRTQTGYILPATHEAGRGSDPALPPMGLRMRLKADYSLSGFPPPVKVVLTAMKKYGCILADNGSAFYLTGAKDKRWTQSIFRPITKVKVSDLEAVDTGKVRH